MARQSVLEHPETSDRESAPLSGGLEEQPLKDRVLVVLVLPSDLLLLVVPVDEVEHDRVGLPDHEVAIAVVDERRDAPIGVVLRVRRRLLLVVEDVEVNGLIGETELLEDERDLPEMPAVAKLVRG